MSVLADAIENCCVPGTLSRGVRRIVSSGQMARFWHAFVDVLAAFLRAVSQRKMIVLAEARRF
jgi:hypothetical protein